MVTLDREQESSWMRVVSCLALVAATIAGCSEDLGTCQMNLATQTVYSSDGTPYYAGQALVQYGCANGVCHSVYAEHELRKGAPFGLNFDVGPLTASSQQTNIDALRNGLAKVHDRDGDIWGEVVAGTMPPGKAGERPDQKFKSAAGNAIDDFPSLGSDTGKATIRNWLACGAPIVSGVKGAAVPDADKLGTLVDPPKDSGNTGEKTFNDIYPLVFQSSCPSCHSPGGSYAKIGLDFTSKEATLKSLLNASPHSGDGAACSSQTTKLLTPGNCKDSLVYNKLRPNPPCGSQMPIGPALPDSSVQALCDWIDAGAKE